MSVIAYESPSPSVSSPRSGLSGLWRQATVSSRRRDLLGAEQQDGREIGWTSWAAGHVQDALFLSLLIDDSTRLQLFGAPGL